MWIGIRSWVASAEKRGLFSEFLPLLVLALLLSLCFVPAPTWRKWGRICSRLAHFLAISEVLHAFRKAIRADMKIVVGILRTIRYFFTLEGQKTFWVDGVLELLLTILFFVSGVGGIQLIKNGFDVSEAAAHVTSSGTFLVALTILIWAGIWIFRRVYAFLTWNGSDWDEWKEKTTRKLNS